jgi:hypothetical protein
MMEIRNALVDKITKEILHPDNYSHFPNYHKMDKNFLKWCITLNFQMIAVAIRSRDKTIIRNYAQILATRRYMEEFDLYYNSPNRRSHYPYVLSVLMQSNPLSVEKIIQT